MSKQKKDATEENPFYNIPIERALVRALVNQPMYFGHVQQILPHGGVFSDETSQAVYDAIKELYNEGAEVRTLTIATKLQLAKKFKMVRASNFKMEMDAATPIGSEEIIECAEIVLSSFRRATARDFLTSMMVSMEKETNDDLLADHAYKVYQALALTGAAKYEKSSKDAIKGALAKIEENIGKFRTGKLTGITTGSAKIDAITGGWQKDQVIVLAGRVGMGKSSVAIDFILAAAEAGHPCGFVSMEMDAEELKFRMISIKTNIPYSRMVRGELSTEEFTRIQNAADEISQLPIWYIDDPEVKDIKKLAAIVAEWVRKYNIELLAIDYVQYMEDESSKYNETERISQVMRKIKSINRTLKIPILALAQLNRDSEGRGNPRPSLQDLKGSGQIEQDASIVIGLFNPLYYQRQGKEVFDELEGDGKSVPFPKNSYLLYFLKFRGGDVCRIDRYANLACCQFSDYQHLGKATPTINFNPPPPSSPDQQAHNFATNKVFDKVKPPESFGNLPGIDPDLEPPF